MRALRRSAAVPAGRHPGSQRVRARRRRRATWSTPRPTTVRSSRRTISSSTPTARSGSPIRRITRRRPTRSGACHVLAPDGTTRVVARGFHYCNGIALEPDGTPVVDRGAGSRAARRRRRARVGDRAREPERAAPATVSASTRTAASTSPPPPTTASACSTPTAPRSTSSRSPGRGITTNCCFGGDDGRTLFATDGVPGQVVAWEGMPTPGLAGAPVAGAPPDRGSVAPHHQPTPGATMRAAIFTEQDGPLIVEDVTPAEPGPRDVVVRITASGICHSDLSVINGTLPMPPPAILGHEGAGIVEYVGAEVRHLAEGRPRDRLVHPRVRHVLVLPQPPVEPLREHLHGDDAPAATRGDGTALPTMTGLGTFAEQMICDEMSLVKVETDLPDEQLALIGCGVTTGVGAALNTAQVEPGSSAGRDRLRRRRPGGDPGCTHRRRVAHHRRRPGRAEARHGAEARRDRRGRPGRR